MFNWFKKKKEELPQEPVVESKPEDKTPAFLRPLYPFRAVGECLDTKRLDDASYITMSNVLYELKCPNPDCVLNVRSQGTNIKSLYEKIRDDSGCPACKLQFGENDVKGYTFKEGEIVHEVLKNNGRWEGFDVRRVIYVSEDVFQEYGQKMFGKDKEALTREESDAICEDYYAHGDWQAAEDAKVAELKVKHAENLAKHAEMMKQAEERAKQAELESKEKQA